MGAVVTVKVGGAGSDKFYIKNPKAAADAADADKYLTENGTFEVTVAAADTATSLDFSAVATEKYYKVSAAANAAVGTVDGITFAHVALADTYKKASETVTIALTSTGTATAGGQTATVTVSATGTTGVATTSTITMPTTAGDAFAGTDIVVSLGTPSDKDIVITISVA